MKKYELSKYDFEALGKALKYALDSFSQVNLEFVRIEYLKDLFVKAHTGYLEIEED